MNDVVDHITVLTDALAQLPAEQRARVLVRGDSGAAGGQVESKSTGRPRDPMDSSGLSSAGSSSPPSYPLRPCS